MSGGESFLGLLPICDDNLPPLEDSLAALKNYHNKFFIINHEYLNLLKDKYISKLIIYLNSAAKLGPTVS